MELCIGMGKFFGTLALFGLVLLLRLARLGVVLLDEPVDAFDIADERELRLLSRLELFLAQLGCGRGRRSRWRGEWGCARVSREQQAVGLTSIECDGCSGSKSCPRKEKSFEGGVDCESGANGCDLRFDDQTTAKAKANFSIPLQVQDHSKDSDSYPRFQVLNYISKWAD